MGLAAAARYRQTAIQQRAVQPMRLAPALSSGQTGFAPRSWVERPNASDFLNDATATAGGWVGAAVQTPARIAETPVNLATSVVRATTGFDIGKFFTGTPVQAAWDAVGGFATDVMNSGAAVFNSRDAHLIHKYRGQADNFVIPDFGERTEGIPILGAIPLLGDIIGGRQKTLGELRAEMSMRGWTAEDFADLESGRKSAWEWGDKLTNDNMAVAMGASLVVDPTNLLFAPGIVGRALVKLGLRSAVRAGRTSSTVGDGLVGIANGTFRDTTATALGRHTSQVLRENFARVGSNLRNVRGAPGAIGNFLVSPQWFTRKGYMKRAAVLYGAANIAAVLPNEISGGLGSFSRELLEQRPLSNNTAFIMATVVGTPVRDILREDAAALRNTAIKTFGVEGIPSAFRKMGIDWDDAMRRTGGNIERLTYGYAMQLAKDRLDPAVNAAFMSMAEAGTRAEIVGDNVRMITDAMLETGQLKAADIARYARDNFQKPSELARTDPEYWLPHMDEPVNRPGMLGKFDWDADVFIEQANEYFRTLTPIAEAFQMNGRAALGVARTYTKEHMGILISTAENLSSGRAIPIEKVRQFISRNRVLMRMQGAPELEKYLAEYPSPFVPKDEFLNILTEMRAHRETPTNAEYFYEDEKFTFEQLMNTPLAKDGQPLLDDLRNRIHATLDTTPDREIPAGVRPLSESDVHAVENYGFHAASRYGPTPALEAVFETSAPLAKDAVFYRRVSASRAENIKSQSVYADNGYMSVAETAEQTLPYQGKNGVTVRVEVPSGTRLIDVDEVLKHPAAMPVLREGRLSGEFITGEKILPYGRYYSVRMEGDEIVLSLDPAAPRTRVRPDRQVQHDRLQTRLRQAIDWQITRSDLKLTATREQKAAAYVSEIEAWRRAGMEDSPAVKVLKDAISDLGRNDHQFEVALARRRDRLMQDEGVPVPPLDATWESSPTVFSDEIKALEADVREWSPNYTVKQAPELATLARETDKLPELMLRGRNAIAENLLVAGPMGKLNNFMHFLFDPVSGAKMQKDTQQAVMDELIGKGVKARNIERWLDSMRERTIEQTLNEKRGLRFFPSIDRLTPATTNAIARRIFDPEELAIIGPDNFFRVIDRASNRWARKIRANVKSGRKRGLLQRAVDQSVIGWRSGAPSVPVVRSVLGGSRVVGNTMYPIFRFMADIRYHAMNWYEANILGGIRNGVDALAGKPISSAFERYSGSKPGSLVNEAGREAATLEKGNFFADPSETGYQYTNRMVSTRISNGFDLERIDAGEHMLRQIWDSDPTLLDIRARFPDKTPRDIVEMLDEQFINFDTVGVRKTVENAYKEIYADEPDAFALAMNRLDKQDAARLLASHMENNPLLAQEALADAAIIQRLTEVNQKVYDDLVGIHVGNMNRSNMERILNSYWMYWPISYQIKATKWLLGVMFDRAGGMQTNGFVAFQYDQLRQMYMENLANNPDMAEDMEAHKPLWDVAVMFFPLTPDDIGVSLSRPVRSIGAAIGIFEEMADARDPLSILQYTMEIGPIYTAELMRRTGKYLFPEPVDVSLFDEPLITASEPAPPMISQPGQSSLDAFLEQSGITNQQPILEGQQETRLGG